MRFLPKIFLFSFLSIFLILSGGGGCLSSSTPGGGTPSGGINSGPLSSAPSQNGGSNIGDPAEDNLTQDNPVPAPADPHDLSAGHITPNASVGTVAPTVDMGEMPDKIAAGNITDFCQKDSGEKKVKLKGIIIFLAPNGEFVFDTSCQFIKVAYRLGNKFLYVNRSCEGGNFEFNVTTSDAAAIKFFYLFKPDTGNSGFVEEYPKSCGNSSCNSCLTYNCWEVKNSMKYFESDKLPDCLRPKLQTGPSQTSTEE